MRTHSHTPGSVGMFYRGVGMGSLERWASVDSGVNLSYINWFIERRFFPRRSQDGPELTLPASIEFRDNCE